MRKDLNNKIFTALEQIVYSGKVIFSRESLGKKLQQLGSIDFNNRALNRSLKRLSKRNFIKLDPKAKFYKLTQEGMINLLGLKFIRKAKEDSKNWDGSWRIVMFDIPEKNKVIREAFRRKLKYFNFYPLQKSVFIYPFDCEKEIYEFADFFRMKDFIEILLAKSLGAKEEKVKKFFNL